MRAALCIASPAEFLGVHHAFLPHEGMCDARLRMSVGEATLCKDKLEFKFLFFQALVWVDKKEEFM